MQDLFLLSHKPQLLFNTRGLLLLKFRVQQLILGIGKQRKNATKK
ncbi:hypothetical protein IWX84_002129 [Flavobacterium sp. CG_9.10]|nr:hypothetical protein [Flavobacterium sp. CG_9.10]